MLAYWPLTTILVCWWNIDNSVMLLLNNTMLLLHKDMIQKSTKHYSAGFYDVKLPFPMNELGCNYRIVIQMNTCHVCKCYSQVLMQNVVGLQKNNTKPLSYKHITSVNSRTILLTSTNTTRQ